MSVKRQEDPAEGSREIVEHELERQDEKRKTTGNGRDRDRPKDDAPEKTAGPPRKPS